MRRAARIDGNQTKIIQALRNAGASVQPLHTVGEGCPDLLVGWDGRNMLIEVKDGRRCASARKLTARQLEWHEKWGGAVVVVTSENDALALLAPLT